ncbi:MAG TPA: Lrp/AsnC ligand binding domain-containing protein [Nitrosopumilus sp.]|jgi:DNA-binding Lrp family transcriptional regulator|nr:Lrp/AsnC ligand binding domain-containing protein [Nitrosopumilus sp.]HJM26306.1 Lrp/AsnC ligand binding domain-containing protein [Nitrosopumilus sp.]HJO31967.1 Lrp/AsnC ligand binding domain-containing protein [Nitrosopumilus sp.]|tara:strand:+ start:615 stop:1142 length:528 start_codon:yes stop_codon:yes gene_type:complete
MAKAYVLMNCDLGAEKNVISALNAIDGVTESHGTFGLYDILAKIESDDDEDGIQNIVTGTIRKMSEIHSTMTLTRSECEELFQPADKLVNAMLGKNSSQAYVVIHTEKGEEYAVLKSLSQIPEIKEADVVFGFYDVLCKIESSDYSSMESVITKAIRSLPHIKTSMTLNVISEQD